MIYETEIEDYLYRVTPERPSVLQEMEAYAEKKDFPIVGPLVGRFLYQMAKVTKARKVLELGSGFGYSAYWLALGMGGRGKITMIDGSEENRSRALGYLERAGLETRFEFKVGDALAVLSEIDKEFDIVFNDIDKTGYPATIDPVAKRLRRGGLFITDNALWSGQVCETDQDVDTRAIVEFTRELYADTRFFTTILPLRDGLAVAVRL
ncbi:MAG: O-methyltransferase [Candidatus Zixiibacteriota bacterium]